VKATKVEQQMLQDFCEFIDSEPVAPDQRVEDTVLRRIGKDLRPRAWIIYAKLTLTETAAGLATLALCPQFGMGFGQHNRFLHGLHSMLPLALFYLLCGVIFVILGAALSGLVLKRTEVRTVGRSKYIYFAAFSLLAYLLLVISGSEAFLFSSLTWMVGAVLGNVLGFEGIVRLRSATAT
jgi:hypothetical protein